MDSSRISLPSIHVILKQPTSGRATSDRQSLTGLQQVSSAALSSPNNDQSCDESLEPKQKQVHLRSLSDGHSDRRVRPHSDLEITELRPTPVPQQRETSQLLQEQHMQRTIVSLKPQQRYQCNVCAKKFSRPSSLKVHIYSHTGEKPHGCPHPGCDRRFSVQSNMRRHLRVHYCNSFSTPENNTDEEEETTMYSPRPLTGLITIPTLTVRRSVPNDGGHRSL